LKATASDAPIARTESTPSASSAGGRVSPGRRFVRGLPVAGVATALAAGLVLAAFFGLRRLPVDAGTATSEARGQDAEAADVLAAIQSAGLELPLVAKPDRGCRGAGVRVICDRAVLERYLAAFPLGQRIVLQRLVDHEAEAGIFYTRDPRTGSGAVRSITLKYFPYVVGDGRASLRALIHADPRAGQVPHLYLDRNAHRLDWVPADGEPVRLAFAGSHSKGAIFRDGSHLITPAMSAAFDSVARAIPDFHFGRFDIRFDDYRNLQQGHGFTILEVNGAGAESTEIWDARMTLGRAYRILMRQWRWAFEIGAGNRKRGMPPVRFFDFWALYREEVRLAAAYPSTD